MKMAPPMSKSWIGKRLKKTNYKKAPSIGGLFLTLPIYHTYLAIDANFVKNNCVSVFFSTFAAPRKDAMAYATSGQETLTGHRAQPEFAKKVTLRLVPQEFLAGQQQLTRERFNYFRNISASAVYLLQLFLCKLLSLLAVLFILFHNLINFKLLNLLFLVSKMSFVLIELCS